MTTNEIFLEDCRQTIDRLESDSVDLIITSPPYFGCRVYGEEELGREEHPKEYVENMIKIFTDCKRILKPTGSLYLNLGDVYFGTKGFSRNKGKFKRKTDHHYKEHKIAKQDGKWLQHKQLLLLPTRVASGLQDNGWILRNSIIWEKSNPIPAYSKDRRLPCYEYFFHFVKGKKYTYHIDKAKFYGHHRDVFKTSVKPFKQHQATFNEDLISIFVDVTSNPGDLVYDPFMGSGTTALASKKLNRNYIGSEINKDYLKIITERLQNLQ